MSGLGFLLSMILLVGPPAGKSFSQEQAQRRLLDRLSKSATLPTTESSSQGSDVPTQQLTDQELLAALEESTWVLRSPSPDGPLEYRSPWHHPAVSELLARAQANDDVRLMIEKRILERMGRGGPTGRFHAALVLAGLGKPQGIEELNRNLLDADAPASIRTNAACALANFGPMLDPDGLDRLLQIWIPDRTTIRRVVAEKDEPLVTAIAYSLVSARRADPRFDPSRDETILFLANCPHPPLRRLAAIAHAGRPWDVIVSPLDRLLEDSDPAVRRSALAALMVHPTSAGRETVLRLARDVDVTVSLEATRAMAHYPDTEIATRLAEQAKSPSALVRQGAVEAAGLLSQEAIVLEGAGDPQASVRVAAASSLAKLQTPSALTALERLLSDDRASVVQEAVLDALSKRSPTESVPLYLRALQSASARTRDGATRRLTALASEPTFRASHTPASSARLARAIALFRPADTIDARSAQWEEIKQAWVAMETVRLLPSSAGTRGPQATTGSADLRRVIRAWGTARLQPSDWQLIHQASLAEVEETLLAEDKIPPAELIEQVLVPRDGAYRSLELLDRPTPSMVTTLVAQFERRPMSPLQGVMVAMRVDPREGRDVWVRLVPKAIDALGASTRAERSIEQAAVDRMVRLGLAHPDELVRESVCLSLAKYPNQIPAEGLATLMADSSERVRRAAIRAAGSTADQATQASLVDALKSPSPAIQAEAASQLLAQGEAEGFEALRRLSVSPDDEIRRRVLESLVRHPQVDREGTLRVLTQFLSDAKLEIRQRAVAGLEQVVGPDKDWENRPANQPKVFTEEQVSRWKRTMGTYFSPADSDEKLRRLEMIRKTQESINVLPVAN